MTINNIIYTLIIAAMISQSCDSNSKIEDSQIESRRVVTLYSVNPEGIMENANVIYGDKKVGRVANIDLDDDFVYFTIELKSSFDENHKTYKIRHDVGQDSWIEVFNCDSCIQSDTMKLYRYNNQWQ